MTTIKVDFLLERETKGTRRFQEVHADTEEPMIGTLYVRKSALARIGNPEKLAVTIEGA